MHVGNSLSQSICRRRRTIAAVCHIASVSTYAQPRRRDVTVRTNEYTGLENPIDLGESGRFVPRSVPEIA
eukprot:894272-Rhodomonas_salina.5